MEVFIEYALLTNESALMYGSHSTNIPLTESALMELKADLHRQAVTACQDNQFSLPHSRATIESTYLQFVSITRLGESQ